MSKKKNFNQNKIDSESEEIYSGISSNEPYNLIYDKETSPIIPVFQLNTPTLTPINFNRDTERSPKERINYLTGILKKPKIKGYDQ